MITIGYPPYTVKRYMYLHEELILADEFIGIHVNLIQIQGHATISNHRPTHGIMRKKQTHAHI